MARSQTRRVAADRIPVRNRSTQRIAVIGNANSGKSTLFNRLTGLRQRTANYPGVTVERHSGTLVVGEQRFELIDLPGTPALSAASIEEGIAVDVLLGRVPGEEKPAAVLAVVAATNLYQGLYLLQQILELGLPVVVALTMTDAAGAAGRQVDIDALSAQLGGVPVYPVVATTGKGIDALRDALAAIGTSNAPRSTGSWPALHDAAERLRARLGDDVPRVAIERALIDTDSALAQEITARLGERGEAELDAVRQSLFGEEAPLAAEARHRYRVVRAIHDQVGSSAPGVTTAATRIAAWFNRPVPGTLSLFVVMAVVFQAVFAWATPMMDAIDNAAAALGAWIFERLPDGAVASLLADGVVAGVGSVIIFLPQILILFLFIIVLEDSGYLARAAYLMDRVMRSVGLSGQSVIPMISSFACAVPGIMATRVIPNRRDRIATILAAPFLTCSARLPVYALLIAAFVPQQSVGFMNLQGLVLFGLYMLGIVGGLLTALLLRQTALRGPKPPFALMLPAFRRPNLQTVMMQLLARAKVFLYRAGTVIFAVAIVVWALAYFPQSDVIAERTATQIQLAEATLSGQALDSRRASIENQAAAEQLEQSYLGRMGQVVQPLFRPLGWDWKVSAAVIAGFPAREVVVAVLGTIYAVGDDADEESLIERLRGATFSDGSAVFTLPMVVGLMIFYAFCLQCAATLAVIRRETNSWRWPLFAWTYMTTVGYLGALIAYQVGTSLG